MSGSGRTESRANPHVVASAGAGAGSRAVLQGEELNGSSSRLPLLVRVVHCSQYMVENGKWQEKI